jgi:hypothetical protein
MPTFLVVFLTSSRKMSGSTLTQITITFYHVIYYYVIRHYVNYAAEKTWTELRGKQWPANQPQHSTYTYFRMPHSPVIFNTIPRSNSAGPSRMKLLDERVVFTVFTILHRLHMYRGGIQGGKVRLEIPTPDYYASAMSPLTTPSRVGLSSRTSTEIQVITNNAASLGDSPLCLKAGVSRVSCW